jgi:hypothetical protein
VSVESGELRLNVVADTSGLSADLKAKLEKVKQSIKVDVKVNTTQIRAELARATRNVDVKITPKVDAKELRAALAAATKNVTVDVTPKVKVAALRAALAAATRDIIVNARVDFDRAQVKAAFTAATAGLKMTPIIDIDRNKLFNDVRRAVVLAMSNLPPIPIPTPGGGPSGGGSGGGNNRRESEGALANTIRSSLAGALDQVQKIEIDADTSNADVQLQRLRARIEALSGQKIGVDISAEEASRRIDILRARLDRLAAESPDIRVRVDSAAASARLAAVQAQLESLDKGGVGGAARSLVSILGQVGKFATIAVGALSLFEGAGAAITGVIGALTAVVTGLYAIAAASGAAVGALVAIPAALSAVVGVVGTLVAGFKGVGSAIQGLQQQQQNAGKTADTLARAQRSAAQTVEAAQKRVKAAYEGVENAAYSLAQAQRSVRDAVENVAQSQRSARNAAEGLADAQGALADAEANVTQVQKEQARSVASAERSVQDAFKASKNAREALNDAYKEAARDLDDYQSKLANAAMDEEGAVLAVERARERLNDVNTDPSAKILDRKEADLAYRESLQRLKDIQKSNKELGDEAATAAQKGIAGSDRVVSAQDAAATAATNLADAQENQIKAVEDQKTANQKAAEDVVNAQKGVRDAYEGVTDAQKGLRDATENVADAQHGLVQAQGGTVKAAEEVTDAQKDLTQAQKDAADSSKNAAGSITEAQRAFLNATPAAQHFARFIVDTIIPVLKDMREAVQNILLPDFETALRNLIPVAGPFTTAMEAMATAIGKGAIAASEMFASPSWASDIVQGGEDNARTVTRIIQSILDIFDVFRNLAAAAQPMIDRFTEYMNTVTGAWKTAAEIGRADGSLEAYFKETGDVIAKWADIIDNIVTGIGNINDAAKPAGDALLDAFQGATENFVTWSKDNAGAIGDYFDAIVPVVESVGRIVVNTAASLAGLSENPATLRITELIEKRLGPALDTLLTALLDSGSGEVFVELLSDLLDILTDLVKSGGFKAVLDFIEGVATNIAKFGGTDQGQQVFKDLILVAAIGGPLALVASSTFKLYGALAKIAKLPGLGKIFGKLPGLLKKAPGAIGKGGLIGVAAGVAGNIAGSAISDGNGGARDIAGGAVSGAATGAGIGAIAGNIIPIPGVGAGIGAAVGAGVGGVVGAVKAAGGTDAVMKDIQGALSRGFDELDRFAKSRGVNLGNLIKNPLEELPNVVSAIATGIPELINKVVQGGVDLFGWIGEKARVGARAAVNAIGNIPVEAVKLLTLGVQKAPAVFDWVLDQATNVISAVADAFVQFITHPIQSIKNIGDFLKNVGEALFSGIDDLATAAANVGIQILLGILEGLGDVYAKMQPALSDLGRALVDAGDNIMGRWNKFWFDIAKIVYDKFRELIDAAVNFGSDLLNKINNGLGNIGKAWNNFWQGLKDWASQKISEATGNIFNTIGTFYNNLMGTLGNIGRTWNNFWDGLKKAASDPIGFIIDTVINGGIGSAWKTVDGFLGNILPDWVDVKRNFATGGVLPGYTPGRDVHMFSSPTGGQLALSGGEAIMRPEWTRAVGGPAAVEAMNKAARSGAAAFANGGVFGGMQRFANGGVAKVLDFGRWLRTQGYSVGENKALGDNPRAGVHSAKGYHYRDDNSGAIDVNAGAGTSLSEQIKLAKAVNSARTRGLRTYFFASDGSHRDHAHFDYGSGDNVQTSKMPKEVRDALTSSAGGIGGALSGLWDDVKGKAGDAAGALVKYASNLPIVKTITNMMSSLTDPIQGVTLKSAGIGAAQSLGNSVKNFLSDKVGGFLGSGESTETGVGGSDATYDLTGGDLASSDRGTVGKGVERWRTTALRALELTGSPSSWINSLLRRMMQESGGNQYAINNTDSNARAGHPSKGLMQTIDGTFKQYALPAYNKNIYDPLSNIIASIRYANDRYGNAPRGWDRKGGYAKGGVLDIPSLADGATIRPKTGGTLALLAERGKSETVVDTGKLNARLDDLEGIAKLVASAPRRTVFNEGAFQISITNPAPEPASTSIVSRMRTASAFGLFDQS